jgi:hypothetical protein
MKHVVVTAAMLATFVCFKAQAAEPYSPVPVKISNSIEAPGLLEKLLADLRVAADKKDLAAVLAHVGDSFFWTSDHGGGYQASATARVNFTNAMSLDPKQVKAKHLPKLWLAFKALLDTSTASSHPKMPGVICLPGKGHPVNKVAAEKTANKFNSDWYRMMFAVGLPVAVRAAAKNSAPIIGKIMNEAVIVRHKLRIDPDATWVPVHLANGAKGWVPSQQVRTFLDAQLCFAIGKGSAWKIVGFNGGGD